MADDSTNNNDGVFVYTEGAEVPRDVVRVRVHPSVTAIPELAFFKRQNLVELELCEGLLEIGSHAFVDCSSLNQIIIPSIVSIICERAFQSCRSLEEVELREGLLEIGDSTFYECHALKRINIPSTVTTIGNWAFTYALDQCTSIHLPDSIENVGSYAFSVSGNILTFKVPPLVTKIPSGMLGCIKSLFSIEISQNVISMGPGICSDSLRNIALGDNYEGMDEGPFEHCKDLEQLFGDTETNIINALKHRFDNLPIHKMIYYQSYNNVTSDELNNTTEIRISQRRSKLDPSGSRQDCLGMTPLHLLACSTVQNIGLYRVLIEKYPETLVIEDRWGALPLLYAVWGDAPGEIIEFLVDRYKSIYSDYVFNWNGMMRTMAIARAPPTVIQNLLDLQEESFPEQKIEWEEVFNDLGERGKCFATFRFLIKCSITKRVNGIGLKQYRDTIMKKVGSVAAPRSEFPDENERVKYKTEVQRILSHYETEFQILREATSVLELALWKNSISKTMSDHDGGRGTRKRKLYDETDRSTRRVSSGADIIIRNVLPYLLPSSSA